MSLLGSRFQLDIEVAVIPNRDQIQHDSKLFGKYRGMNKPPIKEAIQDDFVHSGLRMPPTLKKKVKEDARRANKTMNQYVIDRLRAEQVEAKVDRLEKEIAELKSMMRELLDR